MRFDVIKEDRQRTRISKRCSLKVRINLFNFFRDSLKLFYFNDKHSIMNDKTFLYYDDSSVKNIMMKLRNLTRFSYPLAQHSLGQAPVKIIIS